VVLPTGTPGAAPTSDAPVIVEPWLETPPPERAQPDVAAPSPVVKVAQQPTTTGGGSTSTATTNHKISGKASWYCRAGWSPCTVDHPDVGGIQAYAAAGPRLRAAIGPTWRGHVIYVDGMRVKIIDWCQCHKGEPNEKLLDLYYDVFARVGSTVTIRW
jgi:hypothetical protein